MPEDCSEVSKQPRRQPLLEITESSEEDRRKFWERVNKSNNCWTWKGYCIKKGYGGLTLNGKRFLAHRFSWFIHNGVIPTGLLVLHHCDNRPCVKPDHLFLGTDKDNVIDCMRKGRKFGGRGERQAKAKLKECNIQTIFEMRLRRERMITIGKHFGVSRSAIVQILQRNTWKHVQLKNIEMENVKAIKDYCKFGHPLSKNPYRPTTRWCKECSLIRGRKYKQQKA